MIDSLAFVTAGKSWRVYSRFIQIASRCIYGVKLPGSPSIRGTVSFSLSSCIEPSIIIGHDIQFLGGVDLRTRDSGCLLIGDRVKLDGPVRIVAAGAGTISIGADCRITCYSIINGGGNIFIGAGVVMGPRCSINANEHVFRGRTPIINSGFTHSDVYIGDDVWFGSDVSVMPGAVIANGTVIGANSVVRGRTEEYGIYVGSPARRIGTRGED